jgi:SAM-dependent methyltransferase
MQADGSAFFDDETVFAQYLQGRHRTDSPNETLEKPVLLELLGDVAGLRVLDLGCGDAALGQDVLARGAHQYVGVEGSGRMAELARQTLAGTTGEINHSPIEHWNYPPRAFDRVVARLVLHYVAEIAPVFGQIYQTLTPGGLFVFSVEHPVISSCDRGWPTGTLRQDWIVDDYFETGLRITAWLGGQVRKFHRTVEDYFVTLQAAGFTVESLRESRPQRERFVDEATYIRRKRIPLFLFLAGRKS